MLKSKKNVFWEALLVTIVVFFFGLLLGVAYEGSRLDRINDYYAISEISLMDAVALNSLIDLNNSNCEVLADSHLAFADKIYEEARLLEKYESSGKITEDLKIAHKKYDLLRTFLWINLIKSSEKCDNGINSVVYLYEYESEDLAKKATQNVWSKILFDLKQEEGAELILIPIAVDSGLTSLESILQNFEVESFPAVIINNEIVLEELSSVDEIKSYLN